jgi:hypothetical protein
MAVDDGQQRPAVTGSSDKRSPLITDSSLSGHVVAILIADLIQCQRRLRNFVLRVCYVSWTV